MISDFERDDLHREIARTQGQLATRFGYDRLGRKIWQDTRAHDAIEPVLRKEWQYDRAGELVKKFHSRNGKTRYTYDPLGRITSALHEDGGELFQWDAAANLVDPIQVRGYVKHNRVTVFEDKRYEYDVHGRLETKRIGRHTEQQFLYDGEHRLREVQTVCNGVRQTVCFDYDALGRRIRKHGASGDTLFLWDGLQMAQERCNGKVMTYIYEPGGYSPVSRIVGKSLINGATQHFHNDFSGAPEELLDHAGFSVWRGTGKTWRGPSVALGSSVNPCVDVSDQNMRFQGQYHDRETGLYYNTFRYFDPEIGRFISPDPIGLNGGINLYQYGPNPLRWADPLGWAFGTGKGQHHATATVFDAEGRIKSVSAWQSGNMTPEEAALKFPRSSLATHTEARITRGIEAVPGDRLIIEGQYRPCKSCKGKMNTFTTETGVSATYTWPGEDGTANVWESKPRKPRRMAGGCKTGG